MNIVGLSVTMHYTFEGTHKGDLSGIPPTGKLMKIGGMIIRQMKDGQIVRDWDSYDLPMLIAQLGIG